MEHQISKKRSIIIDTILLSAIFSIFLTIIFITFIDKQTIDNQTNKQTVDKQSNLPVFSIPKSETSETSSSYSHIRIVTDVSNDPYIPFAIQYPMTTHAQINEEIVAIVTAEKQQYIKDMQSLHLKYEEKIVGELNISFEMYEYDENYFSFLLHKRRSIPGNEPIQSYNTFVMDNENGNLIGIETLLNYNEESLKTLSSQIQALLLNEEKFSHINQSVIKQQTFANWKNFKHFIIHDEQINFYFNNLIGEQLFEPLTLSLDLSIINPLLNEQFQIQMVKEETAVTPVTTEKKLVALTFDDGPHPDVTPLIVGLLEKYNAKATFFMLGSRVHYYPEIARYVYESGHEIGNHTWNHPILTNMTEAQILKEYSMTEQAIIQAIGVPSTIFRPPYGATNGLVKSAIASPQFNWTVDTEDWRHRSAEKLLPAVQQTVHPNAIILMHDIHLSTAYGLEAVLEYLHKEGYEFVTISQMMSEK